MQIKDEGNDGVKGGTNNNIDQLMNSNLNSERNGVLGTGRNELNETGLSSTFKSIDLPPKEYELQLQQYEAEVRNHIKIEQQLKLHIEVLNERIEEVEKEKEEIKQAMVKEQKETERRIKEKCENIIDQKKSEIARITRDLQVTQAQLKQSKTQMAQVIEQLNGNPNLNIHAQNSDGQIQFRKYHPQIQQ